MSVYLVGLANSTASHKLVNEGGKSGPPVVTLNQVNGAEITAMSSHRGAMQVLQFISPSLFSFPKYSFVSWTLTCTSSLVCSQSLLPSYSYFLFLLVLRSYFLFCLGPSTIHSYFLFQPWSVHNSPYYLKPTSLYLVP